jgi:hypothetical protein
MSAGMGKAAPSTSPRHGGDDGPRRAGPSLLQRIEADLASLSPQLRKVATHLIRERGLPHRHRITDLAMFSGTAPVTVVRFAKHFGFKGFCELKSAFLEEAGTPPGVADTAIVRPRASGASVAEQSLDGALRTIGDLRPIVDQPGFLQAARWLHEADVVWVDGLMPGDALAADCVPQSLQRGVSVRSGCVTRMAVHACAPGGKSVHLHVALASPPHRASDILSPCIGQTCRRIVLSRSPHSNISCAERSITLGIDIDVATQALPAVVGLLAAWDGAIRFLRNDH